MRVIDAGHTYELDNLKEVGVSLLSFFKDSELHDKGQSGPSVQEVMRAVIDRVQYLDSEKPWAGNAEIIQRAREIIVLFEMRALFYKVVKGELEIEKLPLGDDGHIVIGGSK